MKTRGSATGKLPSLQHLFATLLLTVCVVETLVHFFMPLVIPDSLRVYQSIVDALLLSAVTAPFVWAIIARPMRAVAVSESVKAERMLSSIIEAVICFDAQGRIESLNPAAERMFGWQSHEIVGRHLTTIVPQLADGTGPASRSKGAPEGSVPNEETIGRHRDGSLLHVLITISSLNISAPPLFVAVLHDVSEQKRAALALEEQREFSLKLVQDFAVPCFVLAPDHKVLVWNKACEELTGITLGEVLGTDLHWKGFYEEPRPTLADIVLDGVPPELYAGWRKSTYIEDGLQCEGWLRIGGKDRYLFFDAVPVRNSKGEVIAAIETLQDLTERIRAEEAMAKSEEKFFKAFHASPDGIVLNTKEDGLFVEANEAFIRMLGYRSEEIIGHTSMELGLWVDRRQRERIVDRTNREGAVRNVEVDIRVKSGQIRTLLWSSDVINLNAKDYLIVALRDITDHKETERQLLKSKAELTTKHEQLSIMFGQVEAAKREWETTMDCINDMIILFNPQGRVKRCNRAAREFIGVSQGEILGWDWQQVVEKTGLPLPQRSAAQGFFSCELNVEASETWVAVTSYPDSQGENGKSGTILTLHDITGKKRAALELLQAYTELKEAHTQMIQQEKMASLGQLAAGVAHEINNPTGYIISNLATLDKYRARLVDFINVQNGIIVDLDPSEGERLAATRKQMKIDHIIGDLPELVRESLDGAERIKNIVLSLKSFSRKDSDQCTVTSLTDCLESTINIIWNEIKYNATLKKEFGEVPAIRCYPQKLSQVFMNLIVNAAHALGEKGEITIRTWQKNGAAYVSVADTGSGIPEGIRSRIFEAFFTTKEVGKGTGLGLSISREIVREHGGEITVESTVGTGTTFTVMLPLNGVQEVPFPETVTDPAPGSPDHPTPLARSNFA